METKFEQRVGTVMLTEKLSVIERSVALIDTVRFYRFLSVLLLFSTYATMFISYSSIFHAFQILLQLKSGLHKRK
jgi:hypothetical protein